jgi:hypothetical protein
LIIKPLRAIHISGNRFSVKTFALFHMILIFILIFNLISAAAAVIDLPCAACWSLLLLVHQFWSSLIHV